VARLATSLSEIGAEVGLWAADQSARDCGLVPIDSTVAILDGSAQEALEYFGRPDVIHDNGLWLRHNHRLAMLARRRRIPRIVSTRGMLEPWALRHKPLKKRVAWAAYQQKDLQSASCLHASTAAEAANLSELNLGVPIGVVANGVEIPNAGDRCDDARNHGIDGSRTALFLGRIYPIKGLPMLLEAWASVRPPNWKLRIVGPDEGGHRAQLERQVKEANLGDEVSFRSAVVGEEKSMELRSADLFVLPTHSESFGMAVAEAMSYGLPVLTTTAAPWPCLEAKSAGWRVGADPDSLASGLREATLKESSTLQEMGGRGREIVARDYQWSEIARRFVELYDSASPAAALRN
jgi:glycosyltransferase involved in cell wall biosynthesis